MNPLARLLRHFQNQPEPIDQPPPARLVPAGTTAWIEIWSATPSGLACQIVPEEVSE